MKVTEKLGTCRGETALERWERSTPDVDEVQGAELGPSVDIAYDCVQRIAAANKCLKKALSCNVLHTSRLPPWMIGRPPSGTQLART